MAPKAAAERLGHASVGLFHDTYAHMLQELDADAAAKLQGRDPPPVGDGVTPGHVTPRGHQLSVADVRRAPRWLH